MVNIDCFARMIGMPSLKKQMLAACTPEELGYLEAYAEGVNAYLQRQGKKLPLEFSSMHFVPEPWSALDTLSAMPYLAWFLLSAAYAERVLAIAQGSALTLREWNDMFPVAPDATLPPDTYFDSLARLKMGALHPCALAMHGALPEGYGPSLLEQLVSSGAQPGTGSNNWIVAHGSDGAPLLANDPHLGVTLPPIWYFCHLCVPGALNVAGTSIAGIPGIVLGRNEHVAWGVTNVMLDAVDVLIFRVDPEHPTRYRVGSAEKEMWLRHEELRLPHGKSVSVPLYQTEHGPVITNVAKGIEAVAVLKWAGTLPDGTLADRTFGGLVASMRATSAEEVLAAGRKWSYVSMNLVAGDDAGHIGWHATGAVPVRRGYSGRLPADGTAGADWSGFVPYDSLPHVFDPPRGWIATANYRPEGPETGRPLSYSWCPPYRYRRIVDALQNMHGPRAEDFIRLQMDLHSLQADRVLPALLAHPFTDPRAIEAARMLAGWDREVTAKSAAAAVYEVAIIQLEKELIEKRLGKNTALYFNARMYGIVDEILQRPDSPLWNEATGEKVSAHVKIEKALIRTMEFCEQRMGRNHERWAWGRIHRHMFRHPGATTRLTKMLLNPRPFPADGDSNTLNVSWSMPARDSYDATTIPSMRMVTSLASPDSLLIVGPLGQSGQPGHPHYEDMNEPWRKGRMISIPLTRPGVEGIAQDTLTLEP